MSLTATQSSGARTSIAARDGLARGPLNRAWHAVSRPIRIQLQQKLLHDLPDRILKDIGVSRSEIGWVAGALVDGHDPRQRRRDLDRLSPRLGEQRVSTLDRRTAPGRAWAIRAAIVTVAVAILIGGFGLVTKARVHTDGSVAQDAAARLSILDLHRNANVRDLPVPMIDDLL